MTEPAERLRRSSRAVTLMHFKSLCSKTSSVKAAIKCQLSVPAITLNSSADLENEAICSVGVSNCAEERLEKARVSHQAGSPVPSRVSSAHPRHPTHARARPGAGPCSRCCKSSIAAASLPLCKEIKQRKVSARSAEVKLCRAEQGGKSQGRTDPKHVSSTEAFKAACISISSFNACLGIDI